MAGLCLVTRWACSSRQWVWSQMSVGREIEDVVGCKQPACQSEYSDSGGDGSTAPSNFSSQKRHLSTGNASLSLKSCCEFHVYIWVYEHFRVNITYRSRLCMYEVITVFLFFFFFFQNFKQVFQGNLMDQNLNILQDLQWYFGLNIGGSSGWWQTQKDL